MVHTPVESAQGLGQAAKTPLLDKLIVALVLLVGALPFGQAFQVRLGPVFSGFELLYLLIILIVVLRVAVTGAEGYILPLILFLYVIVSYGLVSMMVRPQYSQAIVNQSRFYLPFVVASLLLTIRLRVPVRAVLLGFAASALVSAVSALYIQYFDHQFLAKVLTQEVLLIAQAGRMYWPNGTLIFFTLLAFVHVTKPNLLVKGLLLSSVLSSVIGLLVAGNRTMFLGVAVLTGLLFFPMRSAPLVGRNRTARAAVVLGLSGLAVWAMLSIDPHLQGLMSLRLFGHGDIAGVYEADFADSRFLIYAEYFELASKYMPLGVGLGIPLGNSAYTTDISLLSFLLPFGIFGLIAFSLFLRVVFHLIKANPNRKFALSFRYVLFISLLVSTNVDLYSRSTFVVYFALLASLFQYGSGLDSEVQA